MNLTDLIIAVTRRRPISPILEEQELSPTTRLSENGTSSESETEKTKAALKRSLDLKDLILYGVGCSVGAGIYSLVVRKSLRGCLPFIKSRRQIITSPVFFGALLCLS